MRAALVLLLFAPPALAHKMTLDVRATPTELVIVAGYDEDMPAEKAKVVVHRGEAEIARGIADDTGTARFPRPAAGRVRIVADDGAGHRAETEFDVPATATAEQAAETPARGPRTAAGVAAILCATLAWKILRRRQ